MVTVVLGTTVYSRYVAWVGHNGSARLLFLVVLSDLADEVRESLVDVDALLGRRFNEFATKVFCKISALIHANLALVFKVALVGDDDDRERILILDTENLLMEGANFLEGIARGDGIYQKEALARSHVLFAHCPVFFLSGGVQNVEKCDLVINNTLFTVRILNGRVIFIHKVALNELDGESGFPDTTSANDDELVLSQELSPRHCVVSQTGD